MGLFDTVECEYPLPDPQLQNESFQTKDLGCTLETYTITADGRLVRHARATARASLDRNVEWPIHGDILIYTSDPDRGQALIDLVVRFTHGRVEWIRRLEPGHDPRGAPKPEPWQLSGRWSVAPPPVPAEDARVSAESSVDPPSEFSPRQLAPQEDEGDEEARIPERRLLQGLDRDRVELRALLERSSDHWGFEDPVYRFYHQSWKVYAIQETTESMVRSLRALCSERDLNPWFREIIEAGTNRRFTLDDNARWPDATRPLLEAFFHARYFLEMAVRYSGLEEPPEPLPSGYAALLSLYGLR